MANSESQANLTGRSWRTLADVHLNFVGYLEENSITNCAFQTEVCNRYSHPGANVEFLIFVSKILGFTFTLVEHSNKDDALGAISNGSAVAVLNFFAQNDQCCSFGLCTTPVYYYPTSLIYRPIISPVLFHRAWFLLPFDSMTWLCVIHATLFLSITVCALNSVTNAESPNSWRVELKKFFSAAYRLFGYQFNQIRSMTRGSRRYGLWSFRLLKLVAAFAGIMIISYYTSTIISVLFTGGTIAHNVRSSYELLSRTASFSSSYRLLLVCVRPSHSTPERCFDHWRQMFDRTIAETEMSLFETTIARKQYNLLWVENDSSHEVVRRELERTPGLVYVDNYVKVKEIANCSSTLDIMEANLAYKRGYSILFASNMSDLVREFDKILNIYLEENIYMRYLSAYVPRCNYHTFRNESTRPLKVEQFMYLFVLVAIGCVIGLGVLALELSTSLFQARCR